MDFTLDDNQLLLRDSARQFARKSSPITRARKLRAEAPGWEPAVWKAMGELGWQMLTIPEDKGGLGGSLVDAMLLVQELARSLVPEPIVSSSIVAGSSTSHCWA